jgi:hypothetical protein
MERTHALPFIRGAGYMSRERGWESELLHAQQVCGRKTFSMQWVPELLLVAWLLVWLPVPVLCLPMQMAGEMNAFDASVHVWVRGLQTTREGSLLAGSGLLGERVRWLPWFLAVFPHKNNSQNTHWFGVVFHHENKSRKPKKYVGSS